MDAEDLKIFLKSHKITPNFTYGQNFLVDDIVLQDIVDAAEVTKEDTVLEIGPGIGNLTRKLCERAGFVLSVEKDPKFYPILRSLKKDFPDNFRFEVADALEFNFQDIFAGKKEVSSKHEVFEPRPYKVVANIPYYITGKILQMFLTAKYKPTSITVLTQKEVAQNLAATAGNLGILAISVQLFGKPKLVQTVLARSFYPAPKVDSAIVKIDLFEKPRYEIKDEKKFFKIIKACFSGKRKQIHNTLVNNLHLKKSQAIEILNSIKINPVSRPQELTIEQWVELNNKILNTNL
jgi:16S rRNA (adenine1518-N6/adenine1519-N6)-dimethyltransferase